MYELDPQSQQELDRLCEELGKPGTQLREAVARVCADPSGQREPRHRYTEKFHEAHRFARLGRGEAIFEFKPNQWRALVRFVEVKKDGKVHRLAVFVPIGGKKGKRFFNLKDCPWH